MRGKYFISLGSQERGLPLRRNKLIPATLGPAGSWQERHPQGGLPEGVGLVDSESSLRFFVVIASCFILKQLVKSCLMLKPVPSYNWEN